MTRRYLLNLPRRRMLTPIMALFVFWFTNGLGAAATTVKGAGA